MDTRHTGIKGVIVAGILLLATGGVCAAPPIPAVPEPQLNYLSAPAATPLEELVANSSPREALRGYASYYASRFIGRRTTSGERYHPDRMTAAHYSLPLGTVVLVVNPATGHEVRVTVNDRCAWKPFPFIDLSRAAAKRIGLWGKGKIRVVIIPLPEKALEEPA